MFQPTSRRQMMMHLLAPAALISMVGCATGSSAPSERERHELTQRAQDYWAHMKANDRLSAWKYEAASKDKSITLEGYLKRGGVVYDSVDVRGILHVEADDSELDVRMRYSVPSLRIKGVEVEVRDRWRKIDGEWFHVHPRNPMFNSAS